MAQLGTEGIERFAIGLGIGAIVAVVRIADDKSRSRKSLGGAAEAMQKLGTVMMFVGGIAWAAGYAVPWSAYLAIIGFVVAAAAWYSVYLPRRPVSKV